MNIRATICIRTSYNPTLRKVQYYCSRLLNVNRRFVTKTLKKKNRRTSGGDGVFEKQTSYITGRFAYARWPPALANIYEGDENEN